MLILLTSNCAAAKNHLPPSSPSSAPALVQPIPAPWTPCPAGMPFVACLNRDQLIAIRTNQKTAIAERDRALVDERERRMNAEAQRDAAAAARDHATVAGWAGGTTGAVIAAALAVVLTYLAVRK